MNLLYNSEILKQIAPFIKFAFSDMGDAIVNELGYVPIPNQDEMLTRLAKAQRDALPPSEPVWAETTPPEADDGTSAAFLFSTNYVFFCAMMFVLTIQP
jgi:hypothetical protein